MGKGTTLLMDDMTDQLKQTAFWAAKNAPTGDKTTCRTKAKSVFKVMDSKFPQFSWFCLVVSKDSYIDECNFYRSLDGS